MNQCDHDFYDIRDREFTALDLVDFLWKLKILDFNSEDLNGYDYGSVFANFNILEKCILCGVEQPIPRINRGAVSALN